MRITAIKIKDGKFTVDGIKNLRKNVFDVT